MTGLEEWAKAPTFPPPVLDVPTAVTRVQDCNCGGLNMHLTDCSLWDLDATEIMANLNEAQQRLADHTAALNAHLHAAIEGLKR